MKKTLIFLISSTIITSCVPQSKYKDLEKKYYAALQGKTKNQNDLEKKNAEMQELIKQYSSLKEKQEELAKKKVGLDNEFTQLQEEYTQKLKSLEDLKIKNDQISKEALLKDQDKKRLLGQLEETQEELQAKIKRVEELEDLINKQKQTVTSLKNKLKTALKNYEGKGITVEEKDGYVYISMENKLLFPSASWTVEKEGIKALASVSTVLKKDNSLKILIQGHTDTDRYSGNGNIKDNWDLSVMRATAITKILESNGVSPLQMTASGKGEFEPIADNSTASGKAINRRVDIIITPDLSQITKLLNDL